MLLGVVPMVFGKDGGDPQTCWLQLSTHQEKVKRICGVGDSAGPCPLSTGRSTTGAFWWLPTIGCSETAKWAGGWEATITAASWWLTLPSGPRLSGAPIWDRVMAIPLADRKSTRLNS